MFTDPIKNLKLFGLKEDDIVADLGAGTGYYSIAAGNIAKNGKVYVIEINKDFLSTVKSKAREAHLSNLEVIWGDVEKIGGTKIKDSVIDAVISSNIFFQVQDKDTFIEEIKRILKPNGRVLLIDWSDNSIMNAINIVPKEKARTLFEKKNFLLERDIGVGDHHYGMIFIKK